MHIQGLGGFNQINHLVDNMAKRVGFRTHGAFEVDARELKSVA